MSTEQDKKKDEIEVGAASAMKWGKRLIKAALLVGLGVFIGKRM